MAMFSGFHPSNFRKKLKSEIKIKGKTLQVMHLMTCYGRVYNLKNPLPACTAGQHVMASMLFFT